MGKLLKVILASAAGFAAGVLMAPKSGKETREDLRRKTEEAKAKANVKAEQVKQATRDGMASFKEGASEVKQEANEMMQSAKNSATLIRDEAGRLTDEAKVRSERVTNQVKSTSKAVQDDTKKSVK